MSHVIETAQSPPDHSAMNLLLDRYYRSMLERLLAVDGPHYDPAEAIDHFWTTIDSYLPPKGCLCLARDQNRALIGCGTLAEIEPGIGELKRLYVEPSARGTGLGRALVNRRIDAARAMGIGTLLVDTLITNIEMRGLYAKLGFEEVPVFPQSTTATRYPELVPAMVFFRKDLR